MNPFRYRPLLLAAATAVAGLTLTSHASAAAIYYVDFGVNDATNGSTTPSPASNGIYYNNYFFNGPNFDAAAVLPPVTNLVDSTGAPSAIDLTETGFKANGLQNGGLATPNPALLGNFAVGTVTGDYFFTEGTPAAPATGTLVFSDLSPAANYSLNLFGVRSTTEVRNTLYSVTDLTGLQTATLQTSGPGSGSAANPNGNDDTIIAFNGLIPTAGGTITLQVTNVDSNFSYLGALSLTVTAVPEPTSAASLLCVVGLSLNRRRRR